VRIASHGHACLAAWQLHHCKGTNGSGSRRHAPCTGVYLHAMYIAALTTSADPASSASSCSPGTPSSPAQARGTALRRTHHAAPRHTAALATIRPRAVLGSPWRTPGSRGSSQTPGSFPWPGTCPHSPTAGSRCPRPASPRPSPFSSLSPGLSPARRSSYSHPRLPAARTCAFK
jgi:cellulase/cellobiase CelA1